MGNTHLISFMQYLHDLAITTVQDWIIKPFSIVYDYFFIYSIDSPQDADSLSTVVAHFRDIKYAYLKFFLFVRKHEDPSFYAVLHTASKKYFAREIPFQLPSSIGYVYENFLYYNLQSDFTYYYYTIFFFLISFLLFYTYTKRASYANSYYFTTYSNFFREWDWYISDIGLMNSSRIAVLVNFAILFFIFMLIVFAGIEFAVMYFEKGQLFLYNYCVNYALPRRAGANRYVLDSIGSAQDYRRYAVKYYPKLHELRFKDVFDYLNSHPLRPARYRVKTDPMVVQDLIMRRPTLPRKKI